MRRAVIRATLMAAFVLSVLSPAAVLADHQRVLVIVDVYHGGVDPIGSYSATIGCSGADCSVVVPLNNRDGGRLTRWCGSPVSVTVPVGELGGSLDCAGPSTWSIRVNALLLDADSHATHGSDVVVNVTAQ